MRIALVSDIHGNLPALEAVVADIRRRGADLIANLGDSISGPLWPLETAQFLMVAYFLLGGAYAMQLGDHVRMDLLYGRWQPRTRAWVDAVTILFLLFYLVVLLYGGLSSTHYAFEYDETSYSAWSPRMAPIKVRMVVGIALMLLQALAQLFKDIAAVRGETL